MHHIDDFLFFFVLIFVVLPAVALVGIIFWAISPILLVGFGALAIAIGYVQLMGWFARREDERAQKALDKRRNV